MESIKPVDLIVFLGLSAMFVIGYIQGVPRRIFGILAILFSLLVAAQLRGPFGSYLSHQWSAIAPAYSYMVAFAAIFLAGAVTLSVGIQITYKSAPLIKRWPVVDELLGGLLGVLEGVILVIAVFLILDPYFSTAPVTGVGEFPPLRFLYDALFGSLTAGIVRDGLVPVFIAIFGFLLPDDVVKTFASALVARR